jgi:hypothetical protein
MTTLGVFRDDFYNAVHALTHSQSYYQSAAASGVIPAVGLAGATDCYVVASGGAAVTETTDTAVNILAQLSTAVQAAYKANVGGFSSSLSGTPATSGIPNLFNFSWTVVINNQNSASVTLAGGTGVTLVTLTGGPSATTITTLTTATYVVTVTGPAAITMTRVS